MKWTLQDKARCLDLSQQFGNSVERLRALVPPKSSGSTGSTAGPTPWKILSADSTFSQSARHIGTAARYLDSQRILMEMEKQIERKHAFCISLLQAKCDR